VRRLAAVLFAVGAFAVLPTASAAAAGTPLFGDVYVTDVAGTSVTLRAEIDPNGFATKYRFEYLTEAAYLENVDAVPPREPFVGAARVPVFETNIGAGNEYLPAVQHVTGLLPVTAYRYRVLAVNADGTTDGPERIFGTEEATNTFTLPDGRAWELVSPVDKAGGSVDGPEETLGGGVVQAAVGGGAVTYSSSSSFSAALGSPGGSQYVSTRGPAGWSTQNITAPTVGGAYGDRPEGVPYQLFSEDLSRGLLLNGARCYGFGAECPVANPPLAGSGAPGGFQNYYLRSGDGSFAAVLTGAALAHTPLDASHFEVHFAGEGGDLGQLVFSSCAALTANAAEVVSGGGCDPAAANLYEWAGGSPRLINVLPGGSTGTPGASLAARSGAVSADGSRVYWTLGERLYVSGAGGATAVDESLGGGGAFQVASADGAVAFLTKGGHLYRFAIGEGLTDLTPAGGVVGVFGASADGSTVYYATAVAVLRWHAGETTQIAKGTNAAAAADFPPASGRSRVGADGSTLLFESTAALSGYDNEGETEVYLYTAGAPGRLLCVSCNPTGERAQGSARIPGAYANGAGAEATRIYKPRVLIGDGAEVFFESSDSLQVQDTNGAEDVYEWEAPGVGGCARAVGCIGLISSGRSPQASTFLDASAGGGDAFFLTDASLVAIDPGSDDVYDARVGGGLAIPSSPVPCDGDACQVLPEAPEDPTPGTLQPSAGNPPAPAVKKQQKKSKKAKKKHNHKKKHGKKAKGKHGKYERGGKRGRR
jgi:hypothetical protein